MKCFHTFCITYNVLTPFPLTEHLLCSFAAYLADQTLAPQTIKSYLSALRDMQISLGLPDPREQSSLPILKRVQAGISRARILKGSPPRIRLTASQSWEACYTYMGGCSFHILRVFRLGELLPDSVSSYNPVTSLSWGDVSVDSHTDPQMIQFHIKVSKYDQFG